MGLIMQVDNWFTGQVSKHEFNAIEADLDACRPIVEAVAGIKGEVRESKLLFPCPPDVHIAARELVKAKKWGEEMITVAILINGNPIMARSAHNTGKEISPGCYEYRVDDGSQIIHRRDAGAVPLAIKLLKTIKEGK